MAFRASATVKELANETDKATRGIGVTTEHVSAESAATLKTELWKWLESMWKRVGLILIILFTVLVALGINSLIQSTLLGLSPEKEHSSLVLLIVSQFLYVVIVTIALVASIALVAQQELRNLKKKNEIKEEFFKQGIVAKGNLLN